jgi:hypothetical protein
MPKRGVHPRELDPATWPFPAGPWVMWLFWLMVASLAMAYWLFG